MTESNEMFGGTDVLSEKTEAKTKKDELYWKVKIGDIKGSIFGEGNYLILKDIPIGTRVKYTGTTNQGKNAKGEPHTYYNFKLIQADTEFTEPKEEQVSEPENTTGPTPAYQSSDEVGKEISTHTSILRQVFLKVAATSLAGSELAPTPKQIADFAKDLEKETEGWL